MDHWARIESPEINPQTCSINLWQWHQEHMMPGASMRNPAHAKGHEEGGLAYTKAWSSLRKIPVPEHLPPKPQSIHFTVSCSRLHFWLYGGLFPTGSLGEGVNVQLQVNKNSWAWQECFNLRTALKVSSLPVLVRLATCDCLQPPNLRGTRCFRLTKGKFFWEIVSIVGWLGILLVKGFSFAVPIITANSLPWVWQGCLRSNLSADRLACVTGLSILLPLCT